MYIGEYNIWTSCKYQNCKEWTSIRVYGIEKMEGGAVFEGHFKWAHRGVFAIIKPIKCLRKTNAGFFLSIVWGSEEQYSFGGHPI